MRLLAIDIGGKRTGFAIGDTELSMVQPLEVAVHANDQELLDAIERVCGEHRPDEIVIGLPLNMDDSDVSQHLVERSISVSGLGALEACLAIDEMLDYEC